MGFIDIFLYGMWGKQKGDSTDNDRRGDGNIVRGRDCQSFRRLPDT